MESSSSQDNTNSPSYPPEFYSESFMPPPATPVPSTYEESALSLLPTPSPFNFAQASIERSSSQQLTSQQPRNVIDKSPQLQLLLIRCCLEKRDIYGGVDGDLKQGWIMTFWNAVHARFSIVSNLRKVPSLKTIRLVVNRLIDHRLEERNGASDGGTTFSSLQQALNDWIDVINCHKERLEDRKRTVAEKAQQEKQTSNMRESPCLTLKQKRRFPTSFEQGACRNAVSIDSDDNIDTDAPEEVLEGDIGLLQDLETISSTTSSSRPSKHRKKDYKHDKFDTDIAEAIKISNRTSLLLLERIDRRETARSGREMPVEVSSRVHRLEEVVEDLGEAVREMRAQQTQILASLHILTTRQTSTQQN